MNKSFFFLCSLFLLAAPVLYGAPVEYKAGENRLVIDPEQGNFTIFVRGCQQPLKSTGPLWSCGLFDERAKELNTNPLRGSGSYCGDVWRDVPTVITSSDAQLTASDFRNGKLTLQYHHSAVRVELFFELTPEEVAVSGQLTNLSDTPVCDFSAVPGIGFTLAKEESVIAPDPLFNGVEFEKVFNFSWQMSYAWDGFLLRQRNGSLLAFDNVQKFEREVKVNAGAILGDRSGRNLVYSSRLRIFARKNETRESARLVLRVFPDLRSWADRSVELNFPEGAKKLADKMPPETYRKFVRAYLAPVRGTFQTLTDAVRRSPGTLIVHPTNLMHPVAAGGEQWDAFPNYFPPIRAAGTREEYDEFVRHVIAEGDLFMPRNSFFYWTDGSDFDLAHGLEKNAVRRIDGLPRTARWGLPGYLVSPSSSEVRAELDRVFAIWKGMGANLYFTNVLIALDPYNNRYDFHPEAPRPDLFFDQIYQLLRRHAEKIPLLAEGGGMWQMQNLTAFTGPANWDREEPISPIQNNPERGIMKRPAPEVPLFLEHEYVAFFPSNADYDNGPYSIQRLGWTLVNGFALKCGIYAVPAPFGPEGADRPGDRNLLLQRTIALLAEKVQPRLLGKRLLSYKENGGVTTAEYDGARVIYNPTEHPVPVQLRGKPSKIAPDGFLFESADGQILAGAFAEFAGNVFPQTQLLILEETGDDLIRLWLPMNDEAIHLQFAGQTVDVPAYPAARRENIPGVTIDRASGTFSTDPASQPEPDRRITGYESCPELQPYTGAIPLQLDWSLGEELPEMLRDFAPRLDAEGIHLPRSRTQYLINAPELEFTRSLYLEMVFRCDADPTDPVLWGEINFLRPEMAGTPAHTRTIQLRYHVYRDWIRFLLTDSERRFHDLCEKSHQMRPGRYYHLIASWDGKVQTLTVNGRTVSEPFTGTLDRNLTRWKIGDRTLSITLQQLRIGGTK